MMLVRLLPDFRPAREHPAFRRLLAGGLIGLLYPAFTRYRAIAG